MYVRILASILLLLPSLSIAQNAIQDHSSPSLWQQQFTASAGYYQMFGDTRYTIDTQVESFFSGGAIVDASSELVFPLDANLVELDLVWRSAFGQARAWTIHTSFSTNVDDPSDTMTDKDWLDNTLVSSTESTSELTWMQASIGVQRHVYSTGGLNLALKASVDWMHVDSDITGFEGWYDYGGNGVRIPVSGTERVLHYQFLSIFPQLGADLRFTPSRSLEFSLAGSSGFAILSDKDDHLLRGRISEGKATGLGVRSCASVFVSPIPQLSNQLRLGLVANMRYYYAEGEQQQRWYRDEGSIDSGTTITQIPLTFKTLYYGIGFEVEFHF
jgi:hypothetical protein